MHYNYFSFLRKARQKRKHTNPAKKTTSSASENVVSCGFAVVVVVIFGKLANKSFKSGVVVVDGDCIVVLGGNVPLGLCVVVVCVVRLDGVGVEGSNKSRYNNKFII